MKKNFVGFIISTMFLVLVAACGIQQEDDATGGGYAPECSAEDPCGNGYSCHHGSCEADEQEDPECDNARDCGADEICVDGVCEVDPGPAYPACDNRSDCRIGESCIDGQCGLPNEAVTCSVRTDCPEGFLCDNGTCKQFLVDEAAPQCEDDEDCRDGFVCDAGECKTAPYAPAAEPEPEPECEDDNDCNEGETCDHGTCHDHPAQPEITEPEPEEPECRVDNDCDADDICVHGSCHPAPEEPEVTEPEPEVVESTYLPDPFISPRACIMDFSSYYLAGATKGEIRGNLPNHTWENGYVVSDPNVGDDYAYMGITWTDPPDAGTYEFSYVGYHGNVEPASDAWALYGKLQDVERMRPEAVAFLQCNWWDARTKEVIDVGGPHCKLRIKIDARCNITAAGNMANFLAD